MKVVVGLGNPGSRYAGTRHNIGFAVIDVLSAQPGVTAARERHESLIAEWRCDAETVLLVKPLTYMNLSGRAVRAVLDYYKLSPQDLLVVCDDMSLPLGKLRLRPRGSHGGHNGLRDIQQHLGSDAYPRLRIGIGPPPPGDAVDYVLSRFRAAEQPVIDAAIQRAADAVICWVREGLAAAMNRYNAPEKPPKPPRTPPAGPPGPIPGPPTPAERSKTVTPALPQAGVPPPDTAPPLDAAPPDAGT